MRRTYAQFQKVAPSLMLHFVSRVVYFILFCSPRDYLKITNEKDQEFGVYCGQQTGRTVLVTGKYAFLKFHSDSNIQKRGFIVHFTAVPEGEYNDI